MAVVAPFLPAIAAGASVIGAGVAVAGAVQQRRQAAQQRQIAGETAEENRQRREAALAEREREREAELALSNIQRQRQIRQRINQARVQQAEQAQAAFGTGFRGATAQIAADLSGVLGEAATQRAGETLLTESRRRQQDILSGLTPLGELATPA